MKRLAARQVLAALRSFGFEVVSSRGSHAKLVRELTDGTWQILTVPLHRELAPGSSFAAHRQAARLMSAEQLRNCLP